MKNGVCKLCNKNGSLTFEHIPPRATFNKQTRYKKVNLLEYIEKYAPFEKEIKGKIRQGGVGYYSLCDTCNNFLGRTYVKDFQYFINSFIEFAKKGDLNHFIFTMHDFFALNVIKQIISMFFSINDLKFSKQNRNLANFILNPSSNILPENVRLFIYLNTEGELRNLPVTLKGSFKNNVKIMGSELTFPPLGYVLTLDFSGNLSVHQEITSFAQSKRNEKVSYDFDIYKLPTYLPFFLDYRSKDDIIETIRRSK